MTPHGSRGAAGSRGPSTECGSDPELRADNRQPCPWETGTAVGWLGQEARPRGASWCLDHPWFLLWVPATAREDPSEGQAPGGLGPTLAGCAQGCSRPLVARFPICKLKRRAGGGPRPSALSPRSVPSTGHRPSGAGAPQAKVSPSHTEKFPERAAGVLLSPRQPGSPGSALGGGAWVSVLVCPGVDILFLEFLSLLFLPVSEEGSRSRTVCGEACRDRRLGRPSSRCPQRPSPQPGAGCPATAARMARPREPQAGRIHGSVKKRVFGQHSVRRFGVPSCAALGHMSVSPSVSWEWLSLHPRSQLENQAPKCFVSRKRSLVSGTRSSREHVLRFHRCRDSSGPRSSGRQRKAR